MTDRLPTSTPRTLDTWKHALRGLALSCFVLLPGGCDDESGGSCVENETQECVCPSGMGAQTCQADGTWGACSCGGGGGSVGGTGGGGGGGGGGGEGGGGGGSSSSSCCLGGNFYACPDADASATCFNDFDPSECSPDPNRNGECGGGGETGGGETGGGETGGGETGGSCSDPGQGCASHFDCCDSDVLCVEGICAASCAFDEDCVSLCCADLEGGGGACFPADFC